jgi:hypothetical protein
VLPDAAKSELATDGTLPGLPVLSAAVRSELAPDGNAVPEPVTSVDALGVPPKFPALLVVRSLELLPAELLPEADEDTEPVMVGLAPLDEVSAVVAECPVDPPMLAASMPPLSPLMVRDPAW